MKSLLIVAVLGLLGLSLASPLDDHNLADDIQEFVAILPWEAIKEWVMDKYLNDEDFKKLVEYLQGEHFQSVDAYLIKDPWPVSYLSYLVDNGVTNAFEVANEVRNMLGLPPIEKPKQEVTALPPPDIEWDLLHLAEELSKIIETVGPELQEWYERKKDDVHLIALYNFFKDDKTRAFANYAMAGTEFNELLDLLRKGNIPVEEIIAVIKHILGWD